MSHLHQQLSSLEQTVQSLEQFIAHKQVLVPRVSQASVGWHLQHSALVIQNIIKAMQAADPVAFQPRRGFWKTLVLTSGRMPRGRARAPKRSMPPQLLEKDEEVNAEIRTAVELVPTIASMHQHAHFMHPVFGHLNVRQAIRLMNIHTRHHILIIRDIVRAAGL